MIADVWERRARLASRAWQQTRLRLYQRDRGVCCICGESVPADAFHIDHVVPVNLGGTDDDSNLATAHRSCNNRKNRFGPGYVPTTLLTAAIVRLDADVRRDLGQHVRQTRAGWDVAAVAALLSRLLRTGLEHRPEGK